MTFSPLVRVWLPQEPSLFCSFSRKSAAFRMEASRVSREGGGTSGTLAMGMVSLFSAFSAGMEAQSAVLAPRAARKKTALFMEVRRGIRPAGP